MASKFSESDHVSSSRNSEFSNHHRQLPLPSSLIWILSSFGLGVVILSAGLGGIMLMVKKRLEIVDGMLVQVPTVDEVKKQLQLYEESVTEMKQRYMVEKQRIEQAFINLTILEATWVTIDKELIKLKEKWNGEADNLVNRFKSIDTKISSDESISKCTSLLDTIVAFNSSETFSRNIMKEVQTLFEDFQKTIEHANELIKSHGLPDDYVYMQLAGTPSPKELWPSVNWESLGATYQSYLVLDDLESVGKENSSYPSFEEIKKFSTIDLVPAKSVNAERRGKIFLKNFSVANYSFRPDFSSEFANRLQFRPAGRKVSFWRKV